jgi:hypothetical protein
MFPQLPAAKWSMSEHPSQLQRYPALLEVHPNQHHQLLLLPVPLLPLQRGLPQGEFPAVPLWSFRGDVLPVSERMRQQRLFRGE